MADRSLGVGWPGSLAVLLVLGLALQGCAAGAGRQDAAVDDPAALLRIGEAAEASGDLATADNFFTRAAGLDGDLAAAGLAHARVLARQGDVAGSLAALRETHRRAPDDVAVTAALGRLLIVQKRPAEALPVFDAGLASRPDAPSLLVGKGVALDLMGRHADARTDYAAALKVDPGNAAAQANLELSKAQK